MQQQFGILLTGGILAYTAGKRKGRLSAFKGTIHDFASHRDDNFMMMGQNPVNILSLK